MHKTIPAKIILFTIASVCPLAINLCMIEIREQEVMINCIQTDGISQWASFQYVSMVSKPASMLYWLRGDKYYSLRMKVSMWHIIDLNLFVV